MKKLKIFPLVFLFGTFILGAQNSIEVEIVNFSSNTGVAMVGLYNSADTFMEKDYKGEIAKINNRRVSVTFTDIPDGTYAISVFHDENEDGELNTNFLGIPKEDYGASNDAPARFGPPKWRDAKFEVRGGQTVKQKINL